MIRVRVVEEVFRDGFAVFIIRDSPGGTEVRFADADSGWLLWPEGTEMEPTLRLSEEEARSLLEALVRAFHGAEDTRQLRKDYDAERARVDRLVETISDVVRKKR